MENKDFAKDPNSDSNWRAIDIFVFSNGQQYSPPRKYHLQSEDIDLWKSTLAFLARTQYGPYHSTIDLFTTRGRKVTNPLELCNGESYVAVQPPDCFINAGYDKYLLKASRSWEKRQAKKHEQTLESEINNEDPETLTFRGTEVLEDSNIKSRQASAILTRVSSNITSQAPSAVIKPQTTSIPQRNSIIAKQTERRKTSIQAPFFVRKLTPTLLPTPNLRNPFKRSDSIKSANNVKITKPEVSRNSSASSAYSVTSASNKANSKNKPNRSTGKTKEPLRPSIVLPKLSEIANETKTLPENELASASIENVSTNNTDPKNVPDDKNVLVASSVEVYKNPRKEMASISIHPYPKHSIVYEPMRQNATTTVLAQYSKVQPEDATDNTDTFPEKEDNPNKYDALESIKIDHNLVKTKTDENKLVENEVDEQDINTISNTKTNENISKDETNLLKACELDDTKIVPLENTNINLNETKLINRDLPPIEMFNIDSVNEGIKRTMSKLLEPNVPFDAKTNAQELPPRKRSVTIEQPDKNQDDLSFVDKLENDREKEVVVKGKSSETLKMFNSSHRRTSITNNSFIEQQSVTQQDTKILSPQGTEKLISDQYKATLKKGDIVNLKLNIQIETRCGDTKRHDDNLKSQSVTFIQTEKESQNIVDDQMIIQNKPLLSLIEKELKDRRAGDNQKIIIVQCSNCKICKDHNTSDPEKDLQKKYLILLPIEKFQMVPELCHCGDGKPDGDELRVKSAIKPSNSCISLAKISKSPTEPDDIATRSIYFEPDPKSNENVVAVIRKKSVAINEELTTPCCREPSTMTQEIDVKSELIEISVASSTGMLARSTKKDAATQTDWCDLLLEAKLSSNGLYSFHLPTLELLKTYKLT